MRWLAAGWLRHLARTHPVVAAPLWRLAARIDPKPIHEIGGMYWRR